MAECYGVDSPALALTAGTARSVLVLTAASTQTFRLIQASVGCDATATGLLKVELLLGTVSAGTTGTAPNKSRMNGESWNKAPLTTTSQYSAEPTYTKHASNDALAIWTREFALPFASWEIELPLGREYYCPESNVIAFRLTSMTVSPNAYVACGIEE